MEDREIQDRMRTARFFAHQGSTAESGNRYGESDFRVTFSFDCRPMSDEDMDAVREYIARRLNEPDLTLSNGRTDLAYGRGQTEHFMAFYFQPQQQAEVERLFGGRPLVIERFPDQRRFGELSDAVRPMLPANGSMECRPIADLGVLGGLPPQVAGLPSAERPVHGKT